MIGIFCGWAFLSAKGNLIETDVAVDSVTLKAMTIRRSEVNVVFNNSRSIIFKRDKVNWVTFRNKLFDVLRHL